ncbi:MAG: hypothetical protein WB952_09270 [Terriglobales bacterium]
MTAYRPTVEGFRALARQPSIGLAEIAWRWSFGAAVAALLVLSLLEYLNTLAITHGEMLLLKTRQPVLISQVMRHIFRGSGFRAIESGFVLVVAVAAGWIVVAGLGRAATMTALLAYFRDSRAPSFDGGTAKMRLGSLFGLNFLRVALTVAAALGCLAAFVLAGFASPSAEPLPGAAFLVFVAVVMLVWLAWSMLQWLLTLAYVFVAADDRDTFGSVAAAVDLCRQRPGPVFLVGTWFGLSHVAAFWAASIAVGVVLGLARLLPPELILGGVLLVSGLYLAVADYLYVGRLAAYVAILEWPKMPVAADAAEPPPDSNQRLALSAVDADELILSDLPAPG